MNEAMFSLGIVEQMIITDVHSDEFIAFENDLAELDSLFPSVTDTMDNLYTEGFDTSGSRYGNKLQRFGSSVVQHTGHIVKRTARTTKDLGGAYGKITSASGNAIHSVWGLCMKALDICVRVSTFVINKVAGLPNAILNTANAVINIPGHIKKKLKGSIDLYFTANDISKIYANNVLGIVNQYMAGLENLKKGETWSRLRDLRLQKNVNGNIILENDIKTCKKLLDYVHELGKIQFGKTTVELDNMDNIETYFGKKTSVVYKDLNKQEHILTYYDALKTVADDMAKYKDNLQGLEKDLAVKQNTTVENNSFNRLTGSQQKDVQDLIQSISTMVGLIGNFTKCISQDMATISRAAKKISEYQAKAAKKEMDKAKPKEA